MQTNVVRVIRVDSRLTHAADPRWPDYWALCGWPTYAGLKAEPGALVDVTCQKCLAVLQGRTPYNVDYVPIDPSDRSAR